MAAAGTALVDEATAPEQSCRLIEAVLGVFIVFFQIRNSDLKSPMLYS
jgi:hypothetical protein